MLPTPIVSHRGETEAETNFFGMSLSDPFSTSLPGIRPVIPAPFRRLLLDPEVLGGGSCGCPRVLPGASRGHRGLG